MATKLVSPDSRLLARPTSPPPNASPDSRQRLFSSSINESAQTGVFQDLLSRFQDFRGATLRVLEWYRRAWKDMSEELSLIVNTEDQSQPRPPSSDIDIKSAAFEGLLSSMKKSMATAESMIHNYCFKRRGKYTEKECKQGVAVALERMANEVWKQVFQYVQKPASTRAEDVLKALTKQYSEIESVSAKLKEAQLHFEEALKRHINFSGMSAGEPSVQSLSPEDDAIFRDDRSSELSAEPSRSSPLPKDLTAELNQQSNRLLKSFQKFASSGIREPGTVPARREMDTILRDMMLMVKSSKAEVSKLQDDLRSQKLERQLGRMRMRVESLCRAMEENAQKRVSFADSQLAPASGTMSDEMKRLRDLVMRQATEIDRLRAENVMSIRVSETPPSPMPEPIPFQLPELDNLGQTQTTIMSDIREMKQHMDRFFYSNKESVPDSGSGRTMKLLKAAAPHIRATNDAEFLQAFIDEIAAMRKSQVSLLTAIANEGYTLESLDDIATEFLKMRHEYLTLKEEHDETLLRVIRVQSESEIESSYLQSRIKALETELEEAKKTEQLTPVESSQESHRRISEMEFGSLEEENAVLSAENLGLVEKLETLGKEKETVLVEVATLQEALDKANAKVEELEASVTLLQSYEPLLAEGDPLVEDQPGAVPRDGEALDTPSIEDLLPGEQAEKAEVEQANDGEEYPEEAKAAQPQEPEEATQDAPAEVAEPPPISTENVPAESAAEPAEDPIAVTGDSPSNPQ